MATDTTAWARSVDCRACGGTGVGSSVRSVYGRTTRQAIAEARRLGRRLGVVVRRPDIGLVSAGHRGVFSHRSAHVTLTLPDWVRAPCGSCRGTGLRSRRAGAATS